MDNIHRHSSHSFTTIDRLTQIRVIGIKQNLQICILCETNKLVRARVHQQRGLFTIFKFQNGKINVSDSLFIKCLLIQLIKQVLHDRFGNSVKKYRTKGPFCPRKVFSSQKSMQFLEKYLQFPENLGWKKKENWKEGMSEKETKQNRFGREKWMEQSVWQMRGYKMA